MKIAIIGGSGNMGRWFARYLLQEGMQVVITGRNQDKLLSAGKELGVPTATNIDAVKQSEVIIISVPLDTFELAVKEIAPYTNKRQIIIDVTSIKSRPVEVMHRYITKGTVLGTHPVFGPGAKNIAKQNFILTPVNEDESALANKIRQHLNDRAANVSIMTPQAHDEMMTVVLGLAHFIAIVSADTLLSFNKFQEMKKIGGTTFKVLYTLIESVISEDPQLYASLQMNFPDMSNVETLFETNTKLWADMVRGKDKQGFARRMNTLRERLEKTDPDFRSAYENMYKITEKL
ncbi:MAG: prephenate dehydrogenase [Dehalococcoidales bacterium]|nr:prephenate dehydrogenase [Dehalococcoidales bacterium]